MIYINFHAPINANTSQILMNTLSDVIMKGEKEIYLLFSSIGGNTVDGITLFNFIRALPAKIAMHNIGAVDSIANVVFLAGEERLAVPNSSFLFHGVGFDITQPTRLEEKTLKERMVGIQRDTELIANIITQRTKLSIEQVKTLFLEAQTKKPEEARSVGIIHAIAEAKIKEGTHIISLVLQ
jgi:ATP-dependent protease ClpP protease subunit